MPPSTFYICLGMFTIMSGFSVVSLNTQGCRDSFKRCFRLDFPMTKFNADIVFLQDIYTIPSEEEHVEINMESNYFIFSFIIQYNWSCNMPF